MVQNVDRRVEGRGSSPRHPTTVPKKWRKQLSGYDSRISFLEDRLKWLKMFSSTTEQRRQCKTVMERIRILDDKRKTLRLKMKARKFNEERE